MNSQLYQPNLNQLTLYDQDYYLWIEKTVEQLRQNQFQEIDIENLIEELETMGRSEKRAVQSNLTVLLMHLLKYKYQPNKRSRSWRSTIVEHRRRLLILYKDSPSLRGYGQEIFVECYQDARQDAATETQLKISVFPDECPFNLETVLKVDYLADED
ncbi:DUF29 domain-containing protein [Planktothrix mougeotii]|uniref:DUF29 domain-containing protein n=1 Tax=Planktothrix mougeotii LEGE 06226 TaxID=1828728 RepID=A0ABR9UCG5_9CYAN|nr:DUF29 domain-containing protein [Planktothrix mougeotii]MBE9143506.1 DUF29 domain-containing protein [Planktothrix mougeotii LEGE 06226]